MSGQHEKPEDPAIQALGNTPSGPVALLHSGRFHRRWARRSLIGSPVGWFRHHADGRSELTGDLPDIALTGRPFRDLRTVLNHPDLTGRWVGYISYEINRAIETAKLPPAAPSPWPLIELGYCPDLRELPTPPQARDDAAKRSRVAATDRGPATSIDLTPDFTRAQYEKAVQRVIDYIAAGDVFQVNLAQRFTGQWAGNPRELYARLAQISPAWYGAYLEMADVGCGMSDVSRALVSTSPELFLQVADRHVVTRPIKGTRPTSDIPHPTSHIDELRSSTKDTAELNMIVDLMRNDLGRVCSYGSVKVTQPRAIETHPTVHHGVATIEGDLHPSRDIVDLLRATLPGGSITGAPKVRAMQIIDELEPVPRGPYTGCIGWITRDACQFNIAIRTMALAMSDGGCRMADMSGDDLNAQHPTSHLPHPTWDLSFHVGGGIVADSDPAAEYQETLDKAQAMLRSLTL